MPTKQLCPLNKIRWLIVDLHIGLIVPSMKPQQICFKKKEGAVIKGEY